MVSGSIDDESLEPVNIYYFEPPLPKIIQYPKLSENTVKMSCGNLIVDESCIIIKSNLIDKTVKFLYASMECDKCSLQELKSIKPGASEKVILKFASLGSVWNVVNEENQSLCKGQGYLGERSSYHIDVNETACSLVCDKEPEFIYYPIIGAVIIYFLLAMIWILGKYLRRKEVFNHFFSSNSVDINSRELADMNSSSTSSEDKKPKVTKRRLKSLDTFRGISLVVMIFVNYGGGQYRFFKHSIWNGLALADLLFPWFLWIMGMSMALSMRSLLRKSEPRIKIFCKIVKRSIILFALGIMFNHYCSTVNLNDLRIFGVLQRFSVTYFVVATLHLFYASAQDDETSSTSAFRDITPYSVEWLIMGTILASHFLITFLVHAPDCPPGYLGPGGDHAQGNYSLCAGGATGYIDRLILGRNHLSQNSTFRKIYHGTLPFEAEGLLGCLTSAFLVFLGLQAGKILLTYKEPNSRLIRWMIWACMTGVVAAILCQGSKNDGFIPVNKFVWSVSFILVTGCLAFTLMSVCYFVIDVKKWWDGAPFSYAGMNSIILFMGHEITRNMFPWSWEIESTHLNELMQDLWGTSLWVLIAVYMYYKDFFLAI